MSSRANRLLVVMLMLMAGHAVAAHPLKVKVSLVQLKMEDLAASAETIVLAELKKPGAGRDLPDAEPQPDVYQVISIEKCASKFADGATLEVWPYYLAAQLDEGSLSVELEAYAGRGAPKVGERRVLFLNTWADKTFLSAKGAYAFSGDLPEDVRFESLHDCVHPSLGVSGFKAAAPHTCRTASQCRAVDLRERCEEPLSLVSRDLDPKALKHFVNVAARERGVCSPASPDVEVTCLAGNCRDARENPGSRFAPATALWSSRCSPSDGYGGVELTFDDPKLGATLSFFFEEGFTQPVSVELPRVAKEKGQGVEAVYSWWPGGSRRVVSGRLSLDAAGVATFEVDLGDGIRLHGRAPCSMSPARKRCG